MADRIGFNEFADKGDIEKALKDIIKLLDQADDRVKSIADKSQKIFQTNARESFKDIQKVNEAVQETNKAFEDKIKLDKDRIKIERSLNDLRQQENKSLELLQANLDSLRKQRTTLNKAEKEGIITAQEANKQRAELNVLIKASSRELNQAQKAVLDQTDAFKELTKRTNEAQNRFKVLAAQYGIASKEANEARRSFEKLDKELRDINDAAKDGRRNVGRYKDALSDLEREADQANKGIDGLSDGLEEQGNKIDEGLKSLKGYAAALGIISLASKGVQDSVESNTGANEELRKASSEVQSVWSQITNVIGSGVVVAYNSAKAAIGQVTGNTKLWLESTLRANKAMDETADSVDNFSDKLSDAVSSSRELTEAQIQFEKDIRPLEERIAILNGLIEEQQVIAGDSTRSFDELNEAVLRGQDLQEERAGILVKIAKTELDLINERVRIANEAGGASVTLLDEQTDANIKLLEATKDLTNEQLAGDKELRQIRQDTLERNLDILLDGFDNQKTINERIIANEKETFDERVRLLEETQRRSEESFQGQIAVIRQFTDVQFDENELLAASSTELIEKIRLLGLSEIVEGRLLEIIRDKRSANQDLLDSEQELNDQAQERVDLLAETEAQELALGQATTESAEQTNQALENLEDDRFAIQKRGLERRLAASEEGSIEQLRLQKELNDLLLEEVEVSQQEQLEKEKELAEQRAEIVDAALQTIGDIFASSSERRIEAIEDQLDSAEDRVDNLREKAADTRLGAEESIAEVQKREQELEQRRIREQKRQERQQALFAILSTYNANLANDPDTALQKTLRDAAVLKALAGSFSAFEGVDDTGGSGGMDEKGGRLWMLHPNEQVWSKKDRGEVGFRSRDEVKDIVKMYDSGMLTDIMDSEPSYDALNRSVMKINAMTDGRVIERLDQLNRSIQKIDIPEGMVHINEVKRIIELKTKKGNKRTIDQSRIRI